MYNDQYEELVDEDDDDKFEKLILQLRDDREAEKKRKIEWEAGAPERKRIHDEKMLNDPKYRRSQETISNITKIMPKILINLTPRIYEKPELAAGPIFISKPKRYTDRNRDES